MRVAVVVLAGGSARRWGGRDKTAALLGSRTVLEQAVGGLRAGGRDGARRGSPAAGPDDGDLAVQVVVAGPAEQAERPGLAGVRWVREDPPGGGPVSGLAAALAAVTTDVDVVVVGAGDAPFGGTAVPRLLAALDRPDGPDTLDGAFDGAVGVDPTGRRQPLLAAYRLPPLRTVVESLDLTSGVPLRAVVDRLHVADVRVTAREALDLDTPAALDVARELLGSIEMPEGGVPS